MCRSPFVLEGVNCCRRAAGCGRVRAGCLGVLRRLVVVGEVVERNEREPMSRKLTTEERAAMKEALKDTEGEEVVLAKIAAMSDSWKDLPTGALLGTVELVGPTLSL